MSATPSDDQSSTTTRGLSPAEVHNVAFKKPPIGKRGYDEEEVDNFLDVVEAELSRLIESNEELKNRSSSAPLDDAALAQLTDQSVAEENRKLQASLQQLDSEHGQLTQRFQQLLSEHNDLQRSAESAGQGGAAASAAAQEQVRNAEQRTQQAQQQSQQLQQQVQQLQQQLQEASRSGGSPSADQHQQAVKVLALAQQTADQHLADAQSEAQRLVGDAQSQATKLHQDSTAAADQRVADAQTRAEALHRDSTATAQKTISDAEQRAKSINDALETRKGSLEGRLEELRTFEREYRSRLKSYLESQLRDLDQGRRDDADSGRG